MKKNRKKIWSSALCLVLLLPLGGCGSGAAGSGGETDAAATAAGTDAASSAQTDTAASIIFDASEMFSDRDYEIGYDETEAAYITLNGSSAECASDAVEIDGSTVTITDEGSYVLSGTLTDGMIIVDADNTDKLQLILDGVSVNSAASAAVYVRQADKVFITTTADSENTLTNGGEFTAIDDNNIDAAVFSKDDLTLNGQGSLTIESPAGSGVVSKDDLVITSGKYTISSDSHALDGKESVRIAAGTFSITAGKDGIHSEDEDDPSLGFIYILNGTYAITAEDDGISASNALQIEDGDFTITVGGGSENASQSGPGNYGGFMGGGRPGGGMQNGDMPDAGMQNGNMQQETAKPADTAESAEDSEAAGESASMKGIKADGNLAINGATFVIDSADDSIHSNASITVSAGDFTLSAGDDAFHADETLSIKDGSITITESYEGLEGLTVDISGGEITITATDDGINAAGGADASGMGGKDSPSSGGFSSSGGSILLSGGSIDIHASGDALDSNGSLSMTGGTVTTSGPDMGDTSILDYASTGSIDGGVFIGTGASGMAQNFGADSTQGVIMAAVGNQKAGTGVTLQDSDGNILLEKETDQDFSCVILSCPDIVQGSTYTLLVGSSETSVTMDSLIYSNVESTGGGRFGNMGGAMKGGGRGPGNAGGNPPEGMDGNPPDNMGGEPPEDMGGEPPEGMGGEPPEGIGGNPPDNMGGEPPEGMGKTPPGNMGGGMPGGKD